MSTHENRPSARPRDPFMVGEINPGTDGTVYDIGDGNGGNLGSLVELASSNVISGSYVWLARHAYWKWNSTAFPASFVLGSPSAGVPTWDPSTATPILTCGPFGSSAVTPVTGGRWWSIGMKGGTGTTAVGWLNQQGSTLNWYSLTQQSYFTLGSGQQLVFGSSQTAPTTPMFLSVDSPASAS